jgi:acetyl-CoA C-acetyltransferase
MGKTGNDVVIAGIGRTPIGKFLGALSGLTAPEIMAYVLEGIIERSGLERSVIEEVFIGNVVSAGVGQAPARQAALKGGLPVTVSATTINKVCGSGLKAAMLGSSLIKAGDRSVVFAGGMESMSKAPHYLTTLRQGVKYGEQSLIDGLIHDGLWDPYHKEHMGCFADYTGEKAGISREAQDAFALESHRKATKHQVDHAKTIIPIKLLQRDGSVIAFSADEIPRADASMEGLARLKSAFGKTGTVTAGNASPLSDGAAGVVLMQRQRAEQLGVRPIAAVRAYATSGVDPKEIFFAPALAIRMVMEQLRLTDVNQFDAVEINEAFAVQALANQRDLKLADEKLNQHGGAIALGHPIGASGARVLVTLLNVLACTNGSLGVASLCLGGGNAVAMAVELE